jgi:ABC-type sulfate/molybdate transport systems ATPase subunit
VEVALDPPDNEHFRARVRRLRPAGAVVEVELTTEWGDPMNVEISQERCRSLSLTEGSEVFLTPKEKSVFVTGYADGEGI